MAQFTTLNSRCVFLPIDDVDTDQIIPARYLKVTGKTDLGAGLFYDWRYQTDGSPKPDFPLNQKENQGRQILYAGRNFGCGSSREHAPWALTGFGFRTIIATSFADIFYNNALKNGLLPVKLDEDAHQELGRILRTHPDTELNIDLASQSVTFPDCSNAITKASFPIDDFSKICLLKGVDELGYILSFEAQITAFESRK